MTRAATALACVLALAAACSCSEPEEPMRMLFHVPSFELTDDDGTAFQSSELTGHVWIASFLYTTCTTICPTLASQLANIEQRTASHGDRVWLVSITVDPEADTPERMHTFAERFRHDASRWHFLTGYPDTVRATIQRGFLMPEPSRHEIPAASPGEGPGYDVLHGANVMLFDRNGGCRGLYRTTGDGLDDLLRDVDRLLADE
jgi:protein SCO1/2